MDKETFDFDMWFDTLAILVLERTGVEFRDVDAVRADYDNGRDAFDVIDEIVAGYGE